MENGFYIMPRGWMDSPALAERGPLCKKAAFLWLVENAAFADTKKSINGKTVTLQRSQLSYSVRFLAQAWGWDAMKVSRFLERCKSDALLYTASDTGQLVITICNYDENHCMMKKSDTASDTEVIQERYRSDTNKNKDNKDNKIISTSSNEDVRHQDADADADASAARARVEKSAIVEEKKKQVEAECKAAVDCWNEMAAANSLSEIEVMTASRKSKLAARIKQAGSIERFMSVIREMPNNPFFLGDNGSGWKATFDFVLQEKSFTKLLENGYERNRNNRPQHAEVSDADRARARRLGILDALAPRMARGGTDSDETNIYDISPTPNRTASLFS